MIEPVLTALTWFLVVVAMGGSAACSLIAWRQGVRGIVPTAAAALLAALLLAALPAEPGPPAVVALITLGAIVVGVVGGGPATTWVLDRTAREAGGAPADGLVDDEGRELLRGGRVIGVLERIAVVGAVVAGYPEAVAVVVAVKGVGRFSELDTPAVRERFIIGSLTSLIWAAAAAGVVLAVRA